MRPPLLFVVLPGLVVGQASPPVKPDGHVSATTFDLSAVTLNSGRWQQNQARTLSYLKFVDVNRMLYVFRNNHKVSTNGATANGGWDSPTFPFRSHFQGHLLTAWAQCYASLRDTTCGERARQFVAELLKCQQNNAAAGFGAGYLSGFPESEFTALESGTLKNGNVPWYVIHKTMAGLLDVWRHIGDANARTALLALAGWVNARTGRLSAEKMQAVLATEFGGMPEVLNDLYFQTGDAAWLAVAQRFEHTSVLAPLARGTDNLNGLHGNTQIPKWLGAVRAYKAAGNATQAAVARNAWGFAVGAHAYAIGGVTEAEHFRAPNAIARYLDVDTAEHCDTYNLLKLTRELWATAPTDAAYFDYYERALTNHLVGAQNPASAHGHITYFSSLNAGTTRGLGPAWGGGTWSTDYDSFWCCMGTGLEINTALAAAAYGYDDSSLFVNLFVPSTVRWSAKGIAVTQSTAFPAEDTSTLTIAGSGTFGLKIRIPGWTSSASIQINGAPAAVATAAGSYAVLPSRAWADGDVVTVRLPMGLRLIRANDDASLAALAYGSVVLVGDYGKQGIAAAPTLNLSTVKRASGMALSFTGTTTSGAAVKLVPFFEAQDVKYVTYFKISGNLPAAAAGEAETA